MLMRSKFLALPSACGNLIIAASTPIAISTITTFKNNIEPRLNFMTTSFGKDVSIICLTVAYDLLFINILLLLFALS